MTNLVQAEILAACERNIGILTLNRPQSLNALNLEILVSLRHHLEDWENEPSIALIVLKSSNPRAFCAGGDVRALRDHLVNEERTGANANVARYFQVEFGLDERMHSLNKPILVLADGICMGGGIGLIMGASHRLVTPSTVLAMPEVAIGYFPDVGSGWNLTRRPGNLGRFLAISGARFSGADAVKLGIASQVVASVSLPRILQDLKQESWTGNSIADKARLTELLHPYTLGSTQSPAIADESEVENLFWEGDFASFWERSLATQPRSPWLRNAIALMHQGAPASVRVAHAMFAPPFQKKTLTEIFRQELNLALQFTRQPDFVEGIRAQLVDKDKSPKWRHRSPLDLSQAEIAAYFAPVESL